MKDFTLQIIFMFLGALLPILFHSLKTAGEFWQFAYFIKDNVWRWVTMGLIFLVIQTLLFFEGTHIIDALKNFGFFVPFVSASVIGFGVSVFAIKLAPTTALIPPQNKQ